jgi:hypothetical protein
MTALGIITITYTDIAQLITNYNVEMKWNQSNYSFKVNCSNYWK